METQFTKRTYTKSQATLLTKSMLIAGIAFLIIGAASFGFSQVFLNYTAGENAFTGLAIFLITLIAGMIVSMLWTANMMKNGSAVLTFFCYAVYIVTTSIAFGWLFALGFNNDIKWLPIMFGIVGGIMIIAAMIAKGMSVNGLLTMGKIMIATAIVMGVFFLMFFILLFVLIFAPMAGIVMGDMICTGIMMGMTVFAFLYIIGDIWFISKASEFADTTGQEYPAIATWFFGFKLLTDLVNILFVVLFWVLRFAKR